MILIAGIGNIFFGDDAFGSEVARKLGTEIHLPNVRVVDFGIRGLDLAYELLNNYDATIIVDATARGGQPGTIYVIAPDLNEIDERGAAIEAHAMDPVRVLQLARSMGATLQNVRIVGCEPETCAPDGQGQMGLSPVIAAAVDQAIEVIYELIGGTCGFKMENYRWEYTGSDGRGCRNEL
jgi:hydrogenase maturation protease